MNKLPRLYLVIATLFLSFKGHSQASDAEQYKTWIPNTNWNNGQNWAAGRVPCPLQDVQLGNPQNSSPLSIALTGQKALKSLSLPLNGELVFHKDAELTFYQEREVVLDKCTEKGNIQFIASAPKMWYNPKNWQVTDGDGNPVSNDANAILHLEKVPCEHDQVLFPKDSSFNVASTKPITVASVTINGESYSQNSFKEFLKVDSGAMQFHLSPSSIQLTGETCSDPKGCLCNTNQEKTTICNHITCVLPQCTDPLEPTGSCCAYCGALMMVKPEASFRLDEFKSKITSLTAKLVQSRSMTQVSISRVGDKIQVVFTDSAKGEEAQRLAEQVTEQTSGSSDFTIIRTSQSGRPSRSNARKGDTKSLGLPLGLGIGLLFLLVLVILAIVIWRRKRSAEPGRRRFGTGTEERMRSHSLKLIGENQNRIELEELPADVPKEGAQDQHETHDDYQKLQSNHLLYESATEEKKTFDNPLYESEEDLARAV